MSMLFVKVTKWIAGKQAEMKKITKHFLLILI